MALAVDRVSLLVDTMAVRFRPLRDFLLMMGAYYTSKTVLNQVCSLFKGFKTFALPMIWKRNFKKEYGSWAGKWHYNVCKMIEEKLILILYSSGDWMLQRNWIILCS